MKISSRALWVATSMLPTLAVAQTSRPNILYIMCDDMGYGDLGCYGQELISTPNIDHMAATGMRFTQAYAGSPVSAPSRASFMTGQHTGHTHVRANGEYWNRVGTRANMFGNNVDYPVVGQEPYDVTHPIIPEILHANGYATGMFGKWAGGYWNYDYPDTYLKNTEGNTDTSKYTTSSSSSLPNLRGIDCFYGPICQFQAHTYYPNFLNRYDPTKGDTHVIADVLQDNIKHSAVVTGNADYENRTQYAADLIHQYALEWLDRQSADKPFLGIFTYTLPHAELWQPRDSILAKYDQVFGCSGLDQGYGGGFGSWYYKNSNSHAQFAAMITRLDIMVGEIFAKLEEKGLADNTIVIFTSDNGPHEEGGADPSFFNRDGLLKGTKRSTHEGGIRIPFIVKGPGIASGTVNDHILAFYDIMPTFCEIAGIDATPYSMEDSQETSAIDTSKDYFDGISFYPTLMGRDAEQKKHKFLYWEFSETNMMGVRMGDWKLVVNAGTCYLYNLANDIHEDTDVKDANPTILNEMKSIINSQHISSSLFTITRPGQSTRD